MMVIGAKPIQADQYSHLMPRFQQPALQALEQQAPPSTSFLTQQATQFNPFQLNNSPLKPVEASNDIVPFNQGVGGFQALAKAKNGGSDYKFAPKAPEGSASIDGTASQKGTPTHQMEMYGQTVYGTEDTPKSQWVDTNGNNLKDLTYFGILAHEDAHRLTANEYGIRTSQSNVTPDGDVFNGGYVNLDTVEWNPNRASEPGYVESMEHYGKGIVDSATRPDKDIDRFKTGNLRGVHLNANNFGELSDADKKVEAGGKQVLNQVQQFKATNEYKNTQEHQQKSGYTWNPQQGMNALYEGK
jgi:hypothetical protein